LGAKPSESRGIANFLCQIDTLRAVAVLRERDEKVVDLSLRSRPGTNVVPVAAALGGGGHAQAAGATLEGPLDAAAALVWKVMLAELSG
jgi:phosphoesterase RecJ-like protein